MDIGRKLRLRNETAIMTIGAPADLHLPAGRVGTGPEAALLFVRSRQDMFERMAEFIAGDPEQPARWIAYPKGVGGDLNRSVVWEVAGDFGWRPVSQIAINQHWSAIRLRRLGAVRSRAGK